MTITFAAWWIPTIITVAGLVWALFIYDDGASGWFSGLGNVFMLIPVLVVSIISWIIYAIFK
jgi:hypothetical protein